MDKQFPFKQEVHRLQFTMHEETADTNFKKKIILLNTWRERRTSQLMHFKEFQLSQCIKVRYTQRCQSSVHMLTQEISADTASIADFWYATADNTTSGLLMLAVTNGWPDIRKDCQPLLMDYWTYREEISAENGFNCSKVTGWSSLWNCPTEPFKTPMQLRGWESVFWPRIQLLYLRTA